MLRIFFAPALALVLSFPVCAQTAFSTVEEQMSAAEFRSAGLEKLSPEELATLNQWLQARTPTAVGGAAPGGANSQDLVGFRGEELNLRLGSGDRATIVSRIDGSFTGWFGKTEFKLENGQVWQQSEADTMSLRAESPVVRIEPAAFGTWLLKVEGSGKPVRVRRIK